MKSASQFSRLSLLLCLMLLPAINARAQEDDPPKIEVGGQFSSFGIRPPNIFQGLSGSVSSSPSLVEPGFGGRFTYNLNRHFALEAEGNFFPHGNFSDFGTGGRVLQGQFGLKAGKRFQKFGVFGKARPGFVSFSKALTVVGLQTFDTGTQLLRFPVFAPRRKTYFSTDLGGVLEFYPSRRIVTRFDAGDTIIRYHKIDLPIFSPSQPRHTVNSITHNFQLSAGIGFRFLGPASSSDDDDDKRDAIGDKGAPKFELGAQFSSLTFRTTFFVENFDSDKLSRYTLTSTKLGLGGRLSYNLNDHLALEAEVNFFPSNSMFQAGLRGGGRVLQGQFGLKAGKRFQKFGIFGKARPGFVSYGTIQEFLGFIPNSDPFGTPNLFNYRTGRKTYFSMDLGGVFEFYPSRHILTRFDAGDTMIRYDQQLVPSINHPYTQATRIPPELSHNLQFSAGVGFRF